MFFGLPVITQNDLDHNKETSHLESRIFYLRQIIYDLKMENNDLKRRLRNLGEEV